MKILPIWIVLIALPGAVRADDGAVSVAAGGLVFRRELGITMSKEVLTISAQKVIVDYEFRNETTHDITTEVAFPVPAYQYGSSELTAQELGFDDFRLSVEGKPVSFEIEVHAIVKGRDVTGILERDHLDVASFGHTERSIPDTNQLSAAERDVLVRNGILKPSHVFKDVSYDPAWSVRKRYHWRQTFPANGLTHIHHEYTPIGGFTQMPADYLAWDEKGTNSQVSPSSVDVDTQNFLRSIITSFCLPPKTAHHLASRKATYSFTWVDFILTTANTWRQPIEDFTLNVKVSNPREAVSFCWDGPVERVDATTFRARALKLVPKRELRIGYYQPLEE